MARSEEENMDLGDAARVRRTAQLSSPKCLSGVQNGAFPLENAQVSLENSGFPLENAAVPLENAALAARFPSSPPVPPQPMPRAPRTRARAAALGGDFIGWGVRGVNGNCYCGLRRIPVVRYGELSLRAKREMPVCAEGNCACALSLLCGMGNRLYALR